MYTPKKIYAKVNQNGLRWVEQDLATALALDVRAVGQVLGQTRMVLTHDTDTANLFLFDFFADGAEFVNQFEEQMTLGEWFVAMGSLALPTRPFTKLVNKQAMFSDAIHAGFKVECVVPGGVPSIELPWSVKTDLLVTKDGLPGATLEANLLASVNGYLHRTYSSSAGLYVMQGGRTVTVSDMNSLGLISLANLGGVKTFPITESMLGGLPEGEDELDRPIYVSVPDVDWGSHTAMLVLLGILIPMGTVFKPTGNGLFEVNLSNYPYLERFLSAERHLDLSQIRSVVANKQNAPSVISVTQSRQRDFIRQLMTISQTFIVAVPNPDVYIDKEPLEVSQHPCAFFHHEAVFSPVVSNTGRFVNYLLLDQTPKWTLLAPDGGHDHLRMHDIRWRTVGAVDAIRSNRNRFMPNRPSIMHIRVDLFQ